MPRKLRELIRELEVAGFVNRGGRGSRCGGREAKAYEEQAVRSVIREAQQ